MWSSQSVPRVTESPRRNSPTLLQPNLAVETRAIRGTYKPISQQITNKTYPDYSRWRKCLPLLCTISWNFRKKWHSRGNVHFRKHSKLETWNLKLRSSVHDIWRSFEINFQTYHRFQPSSFSFSEHRPFWDVIFCLTTILSVVFMYNYMTNFSICKCDYLKSKRSFPICFPHTTTPHIRVLHETL